MATITGTNGNDTIKGTTFDDKMVGLAGNDTYTVDNCDDEVVEAPGQGTDTVLASHLFKLADDVENLTITGTAATDGFGNDGNNVITGNGGPNMLTSGAGIDTMNGGDGNDVLVLGANLTAADKLDGGKGIDTLRLDGDYAAGVAFTASTMINVEQIALADGNDYKLTLVDANNTSSLIVDGSLLTGANTLHLDASAEIASALTALGGEGDDTLTGGNGADSFTGGKGADIITGGLGSDTVNYDGSATGVTVDLNSAAAQTGGDAAGDKLNGIENVVGSAVGDTLTGTGGNNKISGGAGNDTIAGGAGDDVVLGGDGDDAIDFGANLAKTDAIDGGDGEDSLSIAGNYAAGFTLDGAKFKNLESVELGAGFDYKLILTDTTNAVGFAVDGSALGVGDNLNLSGTAETFAPLAATGGAGDDSIAGGSGNDTLTSGAGTDILIANKGDDTFVMKANLAATDKLDGGIGNDQLVLEGDYSAGLTFSKTTAINIESIVVTDGSDYKLTLDNATNSKSLTVDGRALTGGSQLNLNGAAETINTLTALGGAGADTLVGGGGNDTLVGGAGADVMDGGKGSADVVTYVAATAGIGFGTNNFGDGAGDVLGNVEVVIGSEFDDWITGDATINRIEGGFGNDTLVAGAGIDKLLGAVGNDTLVLDGNLTATDQIDGGEDNDTLTLNGNYAAGVIFTKTTVTNVEVIELANGNSYKLTLADDTNFGGLFVDGSALTGANALNLNAAAEKSADLIAIAGAGNDTLTGGNGHDILVGNAGTDNLTGNGGDDTLTGGTGGDTLNGGVGNDTASYATSAAGVTVNLALLTAQVSAGDASGDKLSAVENLIGSNQADILTGNTLGNRLEGRGGADTINGGIGIDLASYANSGSVTVDLTLDGVAQVSGGDASGDIINADVEGIAGSDFGDILIGDANANWLEGAGGIDTITTGAGIDRVFGGLGDDLIILDTNLTATDQIDGGGGKDTVTLAASAAYAAGLALSKTSFTSVERVELEDGGKYNFTLNDANNTGGLVIDGSQLTGTNTLAVNGAAETASELTLIGGDGNDTLTGGKGNDGLLGGAGADRLTGGDGSLDSASYKSSAAGVTVNLAVLGAQVSAGDAAGDILSKIENLTGSDHADSLTGDKNDNVLLGGDGGDTLTGGASGDSLDGGIGIDTASYATSVSGVVVDLSQFFGFTGDAAGDFLINIENLIGSALADTLTGDDNANKLEGGKSNDVLTGGLEADIIDGGDGVDTANYANSEDAVIVDLTNNANNDGGEAKDDQLFNIESIIGSDSSDELTGDGKDNKLTGNGGHDTLTAGAGNDWLVGGGGKDQMILAGNFTALDKIDGGNDKDMLFLDGNYAAGIVFGAATVVNVEVISLADGNSYSLTLSNTTNSAGLTVDGNLTGTNTLFLNGAAETASALSADGGAGNDTLIGGAGMDSMSGGSGDDALTGNAGNDLLTGGNGQDTMKGGLGIDTASYVGSAAGVTVDLANNANNAGGGAAGDVLSEIENLTGSTQDDSLSGDGNANLLEGGAGADTLNGAGGIDTATYAHALAGVTVDLANNANNANDEAQGDVLSGIENLIGSEFADDLRGDAGNNNIQAGGGSDDLTAGAGIDTLLGGDGADTFRLGGNLTKDDKLDGGGFTDTLELDGNYAALLAFTATTVINIEEINLADGNSYNLKLTSATNAGKLTVDGSDLTGINKLTLDGSLETTGILIATGGAANDVITGGGGHDQFEGGIGADKLTGNGGSDTASYANSTLGVQVNLATKGAQISTGDASGDILASIENLTGSDAADMLTGDKAANILYGRDGLDTLNGSDGNDVLEGGDDADILNGGVGSDTASYEHASALVTASLDDSTINTGAAAGDEYTSIENLTGSAHDDVLIGNGNANKLTGGDGADTLVGDCGLDTLDGGGGKDILDLGHDFTALDRINGGAGFDTLKIDGNYSLGVVFSAVTMTAVEEIAIVDGNSYKFTLADATNSDGMTIDGSVLTGANWLYVSGAAEASKALNATGGTGADTLIGGRGNDHLTGGSGNDSLTGGDGNDQLDGGAGNDTMTAGNGDDTVTAGTGIDVISAGAGNDILDVGGSLTSAERIDGGLGNDTLTLDGDYAGGIVFTTTTVTNIETFLLADGNSYKIALNDATIAAGATLTVDASELTGGNALNFNGAPEKSGSLVLLGGEGDDTLIGGGGIDGIGGSLGADVINGGGNVDVLSYENSAAGVTIDLSLAGAQGGGGDGAGDIISNIENLIGTTFADILIGDAQANVILGGKGADTIDGGGGNDTVTYLGSNAGVTVDLTQLVQAGTGHANGDKLTSIENVTGSSFSDLLSGNGGANVLDGADGHDTLIGGNGSDTMTGGGGSDVFVWLDTIVGQDTITDFDSGLDVLDISDLVTGFDPLTSEADSFVRLLKSGANTIVQVDANGAVGGSDFVTLTTLKGFSGATVEGLVINGSIDLTA